MSSVHVVGVGIHPFGRHPDKSGLQQGAFAVRQALSDAGLSWNDLQLAYGGSHSAGNADALLPLLGLTGVQFINVANGCATGGSALLSGYWAIKSGEVDIAAVIGFDKHARGAFTFMPEDLGLPGWYGELGLMQTTQFFGMKIQRYAELHGISALTLGRVVEKSLRNAAMADHAWRRQPLGIDTIMSGPMVSDPLNKFMFCSPSEGGVALIIASDKKMRQLGLKGPRIRAACVRTRPPGSFEVFAPSLDISPDPSPTELASAAAYEMAGVGPEDVSVAQIQDTDSGAEIIHLAENGFCADGEQEKLFAEGAVEIGGRLPINTDGGCISCGEPIGATGLRQIYENVCQLRGSAKGRQLASARIAYSQVYGLPGISAVTILEA